MNGKLMFLVATALVSLAFPAGASAGEYTMDCETGVTCNGSASGGAANLSTAGGETISCSSNSAFVQATNGSSTGLLELQLSGCKETVTFFKFSCNSPGRLSGVIAFGPLLMHVVNTGIAGTTRPAILVTGFNATFVCAGFTNKRITGNIIGEIEESNCNNFVSTHRVSFSQASHGNQVLKQVTGNGTVFELLMNNDGEKELYVPMSFTGTMTITWSAGQKVKVTC
jgi:hypothetical protein